MNHAKKMQAIKTHLFSRQDETVFAILDGALTPDLPHTLAASGLDYVCLYRGELEADMAEVAPYLAILEQDAPFTEWVLTNAWGKHWGIFGTAKADLPTLRKHFRRFIIVYDERGRSLYFRFYDPRVLRCYLPTCTTEELLSLFGPVASYLAEEEETGDVGIFRCRHGNLLEENLLTSSDAARYLRNASSL